MASVEELNRRLERGYTDYHYGAPTLNEGSDWRNALEDTRYDRDSWGQKLEGIANRYADVEASQARGYPEHIPEGILEYLLRSLKSIDIGKSMKESRDRDWMDIWQSPNQEGFSPEEIRFAREFGQSPQSNAMAQGLGMGSTGIRNVASAAKAPLMEILSALKNRVAPYAKQAMGAVNETAESLLPSAQRMDEGLLGRLYQAMPAPKDLLRMAQQQQLEPVLNPSKDVGKGFGSFGAKYTEGPTMREIWDSLTRTSSGRGRTASAPPPAGGMARGMANRVVDRHGLDEGSAANLAREFGVDPSRAKEVWADRLAGTYYENPSEALKAFTRDFGPYSAGSTAKIGMRSVDNPLSRSSRAVLNSDYAIPMSTFTNPIQKALYSLGEKGVEAAQLGMKGLGREEDIAKLLLELTSKKRMAQIGGATLGATQVSQPESSLWDTLRWLGQR
jgi:hypothetical protein